MASVRNDRPHPVYAVIRGVAYNVASNATLSSLDPSVALTLGEYGLTVLDRDAVDQAAASSPATVAAGAVSVMLDEDAVPYIVIGA